MTTPGGVPNLPVGALTLENLAERLQDLTPAAMRGRAAERMPGTFNGSTGGNPLEDLSPFGIITKLFAGFNSLVANADPADINGPEDLPGLLLKFIEELPVIGQFVGLLEAIVGTYDGDDKILLEIQKIFGLLRSVLALISLDPNDLPTPEEVWQAVITNFIKPLGDFVSLIGGLLSAAWIPGLDASKIISGFFPISRVGNLQDTLDALDHAAANNPKAQELIDKICNSLGIPGTGHTAAEAYNALMHIPGPNIGSPIGAGNVPMIDASKIGSGKFLKALFPDLTRDMSSDLQGAIDAGINALRNTPGTSGQAFSDWESALASLPTAIFNRMGGNNVPRASQAQANAAMQALVSTINAQGAAINALQNLLEGANGFSASISFRAPETTVFDVPGPFNYALPSWFVLGADTVDGIIAPAGGGGDGTGVGAEEGGDAGPTSLTVNGTTRTAAGGLGGVYPLYSGQGLDPLTYLDILHQGGAAQAGYGGAGNAPGGGGAAGNVTPVNDRLGGTSGVWNAFSAIPTSATITGMVADGGAAGAAGFFGLKGGKGAPGQVSVRARAAMPSAFASMGTLLLPTWRLNTGVALTDAMTAAASWSRVPPGGSAGGDILIIRANPTFTNYVYLWVKTVSGVTNYEIGRAASGSKLAWKTGTLGEAIPFNAFSITSDSARTFTIAANGTPFDSYNDIGATSLMGATQRTGGFASSDSAMPGSIIQFAFLDTGTPSRITSQTIPASQGTTSTAAYVDLATVGPSVTIVVPPSGEVMVDISADYTTGGAVAQTGFMGVALSGANTQAAADARCAKGIWAGATGLGATISNRFHYTGLTPGTTTFKAMYKTSTSTSTFANRVLIADPKP